jgi:ABC-type dipeptide/oligopeptide/nickel transport system permease component
MLAFLVRRAIGAVLVCVAVTFIVFLIFIVVPGGGPYGTAERIAGKNATTQNIINIEHQWAFDRPFYIQYWRMMNKMFDGSLVSYTSQQNVVSQIVQGVPATFSLTIGAGVIWLFFGICVGVISALTAGRLSDRVITVLALIGISMPVFWLGLLLQAVFSGKLGLLPATSRLSLDTSVLEPIPHLTGFAIFDALVAGDWSGLRDAASHLVLPALTLAAYPTGLVARMTRASMLDVLGQDYIRTARTFGLRERRVLWQLALRNALPATLTVAGLSFAYLLTGTFFVELVYDWPGIGQFATNALLNLDYPVIMGITLFGAIAFLTINLAVDIVQARLDPRVRLE